MIDTSFCILGHSSFTQKSVLREAAKTLIIPSTFDEISESLEKNLKECSEEHKILFIIISAHGALNEEGTYIISFGENNEEDKLIVDSKLISDKIKELRKEYSCKVIGLIGCCYSGNFDTTCFDASITTTDKDHVGYHQYLCSIVNDLLKKPTFSLREIYDLAVSDDSPYKNSIEAWNDYKIRSVIREGSDHELIDAVLLNPRLKNLVMTAFTSPDLKKKGRATTGDIRFEVNIIRKYFNIEEYFENELVESLLMKYLSKKKIR